MKRGAASASIVSAADKYAHAHAHARTEREREREREREQAAAQTREKHKEEEDEEYEDEDDEEDEEEDEDEDDDEENEATSASDLPPPTPAERAAAHAYAMEKLRSRERAQKTRELTKPLRSAARALRQQIRNWMNEAGLEVIAVPKDTLAALNVSFESRAMAPMPPYVRVVRNNKDGTIAVDTVASAIDALADDPEAFASATADATASASASASASTSGVGAKGKGKGKKRPVTVTRAFLDDVLRRVRLAVREYTIQTRPVATLPRGTRPENVTDAPPDVVELIRQLHSNEAAIRVHTAQRQAADAARAANIATLEPVLVNYWRASRILQHDGTASERVVIGETPYRLVRRVYTTKPKIRFATVENALWRALSSAWNCAVPPILLNNGHGNEDEDENENENENENEEDEDEDEGGAGGGGGGGAGAGGRDAKAAKRARAAELRAIAATVDPLRDVAELKKRLADVGQREQLKATIADALLALPVARHVETRICDVKLKKRT